MAPVKIMPDLMRYNHIDIYVKAQSTDRYAVVVNDTVLIILITNGVYRNRRRLARTS